MIRGKFFTSMDDTSTIFDIRKRVFIDEQGYDLALERDEFDNMAIYALVFDENDVPAGTGRLYIDENSHFKLGRICVLKENRGQGLGDLIMRMLLYRAQDLNAGSVSLVCQVENVPFYTRYGFRPQGDMIEVCGRACRSMYVSGENIDIEGSCHCHSKCENCAGDCTGCENG